MQVRNAHDPADVATALSLLEGLTLGHAAHHRAATVAEDDATHGRFPPIDPVGMGAGYFDRLSSVLNIEHVPPAETSELERCARIGIGPGNHPSSFD